MGICKWILELLERDRPAITSVPALSEDPEMKKTVLKTELSFLTSRTKRIVTQELHPLFGFLVLKHILRCNLLIPNSFGGRCTAEITEGWRDRKIQEAHYAKGRDKNGNIINRGQVVTFAKYNQSWHSILPRGLGLAVDLAVFDHNKSPGKQFSWPDPNAKKDREGNISPEEMDRSAAAENMWRAWAKAAHETGLEAGFFWRRMDRPHFNLDIPGFEPHDVWKQLRSVPYDYAISWLKAKWIEHHDDLWQEYNTEYEEFRELCKGG